MKGFKRLNAKQRRNLILGGAAALFILAAYALSRPGVLVSKDPPVNAGNLLGSADSHAMGIASINNQVATTKSDVGSLKQQLSQLERQNDENRASKNQISDAPQTVALLPPTTPAFPDQERAQLPPPVPTVNANGIQQPYGSYPQPTGMPGAGADSRGAPDIDTTDEDSQKATGQGIGGQPPPPPASSPVESATGNPSKPAGPKIFIPAGTMLTGVLVTGVDAPTGREAASQPIPILVRVKEDAILPNEYRADYRECFIIASAMGDLSAERAYMRAQTLSCVSRDGGVIQANIKMWGTGEDGKAGTRGTLVSKQGSILAKAMLAGFASGIGRAFTPQQQTTITSGGSGYASIPVGTASRMAAMGGVSSAADQIAQYYLKLADSEFPVIEVSAGRPVTFIVETGAPLARLEDSK